MRENLYILPSASLIRREAFEAVGGFDERLCGYEDDDLFLRLFQDGYHHRYLNKPVSQWRIYSESTSYGNPRFRRSRMAYARKLIGMFPDEKERNCYYVRALILPRLYGQALIEYDQALNKGSDTGVLETPQDLPELLEVMSLDRAKLAGLTLAHIGWRRGASFACDSRLAVRPLLRRISI